MSDVIKRSLWLDAIQSTEVGTTVEVFERLVRADERRIAEAGPAVPPPEELAAMERVCEVASLGPAPADNVLAASENAIDWKQELKRATDALRAIREARG